MDRSFQLVRTNPRLTTNIKIVVDSNYNLYFESFNSDKELSDQKYKHYLLNREAMIEDEIPKFYAELPKNLAFGPKSQLDTDVMYDQYIQQFDNTYHCGANEIEDQWYTEEFEYLAPLYIKKGEIPKNFIILRVDEPAIYKLEGDDYVIGELSKDNFREEILDKWKCVTVFDMSNMTNIGKFLDRNINENNRFPEYSFFFDIKPYNYSKWNGLDYSTGVYKVSEMFLDDKTYYSNPHFNLEEFITKGFEDNGLIYPNILNMKFLFDDSPATPSEFKKWSMNRYYGFYTDEFELVTCLTSCQLPELKEGLTIKNNIFLSETKYVNPYVIEYTDNKWIQVGTDFYEVRLQSNGSYKIISDINLTGYDPSTFNQGDCTIKNVGDKNYITGIGIIDEYINTSGESADMYADIYLIEILGQYHILKKDSEGNHYIQCDYAFNSDSHILQYWKGGKNNEFSGQTSVTNSDGSPLVYKIYRVKLVDVKDFDFDRIHTHYSDYDYEKSEYYETSETKLYAKEYRDVSIPTRVKTYDKGEDGQYKSKIVSSEYTADDETFEIRTDMISPMFEKNQSICKWGYDGSISHSDYPYKLNNNYDNGGTYNKTVNTSLKIANIKEKTLDYFYRINEFFGNDVNDIYTGFTSTYASDWTISVTGASHTWDSTRKIIILAHGGNIRFDFNLPILDNDLYSMELTYSVVLTGATFSIGISASSFPYGTSTSSGSTTIAMVSRSESTMFSIFVTDANVDIHTIRLTKVVDLHYLNQTTNIQTALHNRYELNPNYRGFNLYHYINSEFDYFDFFFKNNMYYENYGKKYIKPYIKYSVFNGGDGDLPATTLFKGIEYRLYNIEDMVLNAKEGLSETIRNIITQGGSEYNGYKFSVILSENYNLYDFTKNGEYENPVFVNNRNTSIYGANLLLNFSQDGIHIFLNKKYKNMLIIIHKNIAMNVEWGNLNNVDTFGENYGLYYGKTLDGYDLIPISGTTNPDRYKPDELTAAYYVESINNLNIKTVYDNYICYYLIDENGSYAETEMINFNVSDTSFMNLSDWNNKFPSFYMEADTSDSLSLKKISYTTTALKGPVTNIYDKYLVYSDRRPLMESYIDQPLSRQINKYEVDQTKNDITHGETTNNTNIINRYIGYYEPIFKTLSMFNPTYFYATGDTYGSIVGNYVFGDELNQFGTIEEIMYSKVNEYDNFLKLKNSYTERSYYPMVDEIGLSQTDRFIFLSSWDKNFYIKTLNEQTLLQDYVAIPTQIISFPTYAEIISSTMSKNGIPISNGVKLYDDNLDPVTGITFTVTVKNLSADAKSIGIKMKYTSNQGSTVYYYNGNTAVISPQSTGSITFTVHKPNSTTTGIGLAEYTLWSAYFEAYDITNDTLLNSRSFSNFNIYNNLIEFELTNPLYDDINHITGQVYDFAVTLTEKKGKLNNILYNAELILDKYTSGTWTGKTLINQTVTGTKTVNFSNVLLDIIELEWPFDTSGYTDVAYYVYHEYDISGTTQIVSALTNVSNYKITGEEEPPNLIWIGTPTITITAGSCTSDGFTGDIVKVAASTVGVKNIGGQFNGTIRYNLRLWNATTNEPTSITASYTSSPITLNYNKTYYYPSIMNLTQSYLITRNNINYKVIITTTYIDINDNNSNTRIGLHSTTYTCNSDSISSGGACLDENTLIVLSNGEKKAIKYIALGEKVLSYKINNNTTESIDWIGDIRNGNFDSSIVKSIKSNYVKGYYVINDNIKATSTHRVIVKTNNGLWKWLAVRDIKPGYKLFRQDGNAININSIVYMDAYINVIKIDVEETDNYFAGDMLNHNIKELTPESEMI